MLRIIFHNLIFKKTSSCLHVSIRNVRRGRILKPDDSDNEDDGRENILYDPLWSHYESLQDLEDDQQGIFGDQRDQKSRQEIRKREREFLKKKILLKKHFKPVREAPLLTWEAMSQIKYLNQEYPDEWTLSKLEESFPVSRNAIIRILRQGNKIVRLHEIKKHNAKVRSNWKALKSGYFQDDEHLVAAYNNLKESNKFSLLVNAAGITGIPMQVNMKQEDMEFERRLALPGGITTKQLRVSPFTSILKKFKAWPSIEENLGAVDEKEKETNKEKYLEELKAEGIEDKKLLTLIAEERIRDQHKASTGRLAQEYVYQNDTHMTYKERVNVRRQSMYGRDVDGQNKRDVNHSSNRRSLVPEMIRPTTAPDQHSRQKEEIVSRGDSWNELMNPSEPSKDLFSRGDEGFDEQLNTDTAISNSKVPSRISTRRKPKKLMSTESANVEMAEQSQQKQELTLHNLSKLQMTGTYKISKVQHDASHAVEQDKHVFASDSDRTMEDYEKYSGRGFYGNGEDISTPRRKYFPNSKQSYHFRARSHSESEIKKRQLENAGFVPDNDEKKHKRLISHRKNHTLKTEDSVQREFNGQKFRMMHDMNDKSKSKKTIQKKQIGSSLYQVGQCVYDKDDEFLYKIP